MTRWSAAMILVTGFSAAALGCGESTKPESPPEPPPDIPLATLQAAPETLVVAGIDVSFRVDADRNFYPPTPPGGRGLDVYVQLHAPDHDDFPSMVRTVYVWVFHAEDVWAKTMERRDAWPADRIAFYGGDGPNWGPDETVDVVVGVLSSLDDLSLVAVKDVLVARIM